MATVILPMVVDNNNNLPNNKSQAKIICCYDKREKTSPILYLAGNPISYTILTSMIKCLIMIRIFLVLPLFEPPLTYLKSQFFCVFCCL